MKRFRRNLLLGGLLSVSLTGGISSAPISAGPPLPAIALEPVIVEGLRHPLYVTHAGDGSGRLFVVEQPGRIRSVKQGRLLDAPFLGDGLR